MLFRPQLDPVEGILAVLDEGSTTGTNKFGLLLALIDLAPSVDSDRVLSVSRIAEKLIELHWDHAKPYRGSTLRQVASGNRENTTFLLVVKDLQEDDGAALPFEQARLKIDDRAWRTAVSEVSRGTLKNPLPRLQHLPGDPPPFLYESVSGSPARIRFVDGALEALVQYGPILRDLIEFRFVRFVADKNRASLGTSVADQIDEHLFGASRHMPPVAMRHDLWIIQDGRCLYTGGSVGDPARSGSRASLDHVVPWARVRLSAAENFLVTATATNSAKNAVLLAPDLLNRWVEHLKRNNEEIASVARQYGWPSDLEGLAAVAIAQYRHSRPASPAWRGVAGVEALSERGRTRALELLTNLADSLSSS